MKLLVITQAVDRSSAVMGFFHSWLDALAHQFESVTAIGLQTGQYSLPSNVKVLSLGKEEKALRIGYLCRLFQYIWRERHYYDAVFVHMTPIYIILAGFLWKIEGKKILLWYNHERGGFFDKIGISMSDSALYTSPFSLAAKFQNSEKMPAGINMTLFKKSDHAIKVPNSILSLGRISPIKNLHLLVDAAKILDDSHVDFTLDIVGSPIMAADYEYKTRLKESARDLTNKGRVKFYPAVRNEETSRIYSEHELFVNLSPPGLFDKTTLEAMGCETLVLVTNPTFAGIIPPELVIDHDDAYSLAQRIHALLQLDVAQKQSFGYQLRQYVSEHHGLHNLAVKIGQLCSR